MPGTSGTLRRWRNLARFTRVLIIVATASAGVIPILSQLVQTNGKPDIAPAWSTVALATAGALIALDKHFGFSTSWMRFIKAELEMEMLTRSFAIDWANLPSTFDDPPTTQQSGAALARAREFVADTDRVVRHETTEWVNEMTSALREEESVVEKALEQAEEAKEQAAQAKAEAKEAMAAEATKAATTAANKKPA